MKNQLHMTPRLTSGYGCMFPQMDTSRPWLKSPRKPVLPGSPSIECDTRISKGISLRFVPGLNLSRVLNT